MIFYLVAGCAVAQEYGLNKKESICPGEIIYINKVCKKCDDCGCYEFKILHDGVDNGQLRVKYNVAGNDFDFKEYKTKELPLNDKNQTYLNTANYKTTLLVSVNPESRCISYQVTEYKHDYPINWYPDIQQAVAHVSEDFNMNIK